MLVKVLEVDHIVADKPFRNKSVGSKVLAIYGTIIVPTDNGEETHGVELYMHDEGQIIPDIIDMEYGAPIVLELEDGSMYCTMEYQMITQYIS